MKIQKLFLSQIRFQKKPYSASLLASIQRIGLNFPIQVALYDTQDGYICIDGHKRLSAIADLLKEDPNNIRFQSIPVVVQNHARTSPPWHLHNHH